MRPGPLLAISGTAPPLYTLTFLIDISLELDEKEHINLITGYGSSHNCTGTFNYTICTLDAAIGEYNVTVTENKVTLDSGLPRIVAIANNTRVNRKWDKAENWYPSTVAGIVQIAFQKSRSAASYFYYQDYIWLTGYATPIYHSYANDDASETCLTFQDPQEDVLQDLNRLMFLLGRAAVSGAIGNITYPQMHVDPGLPVKTSTLGYLQGDHIIYETNLRWFGAAVVIELVCIALILPTYFGWWRLGRAVSFSPLETAKVCQTSFFLGVQVSLKSNLASVGV